MKTLDGVINPKTALFLFTIPFMCICPLVLTSILFDFPSAIFENNSNKDEYFNSFNLMALPENSQTISQFKEIGGFDLNTDEKSYCDYLAGAFIKSSLEFENISQHYLEEFSEKFSSSIDFPYDYSLLNGSQIKVFPFNPNDIYFSHDGFELRADKTYNFDKLNESESLYIVYLINYNVNESSDNRCFTSYLPDSSIVIEQPE